VFDGSATARAESKNAPDGQTRGRAILPKVCLAFEVHRRHLNGPGMTDLIDRICEIIERHRVGDSTAANGYSCRCGAEELSDHSRHVAQEIVASLGLRSERHVNLKDTNRYVSAWFDDELTKLEGAE
jgi:hypothetical protein